jgi:hypothetical protein
MSHRDRERILDWVVAQYERLLVTALECGEVAFDGEDPAFVARTIHAMYLAEIRHWIMTDNPQPSEAVKNLRRSFRLLLRGINYKPTPKHAIAGLSPHSQASSITSTLCTTCTEMGAS